jgi:sulfur relay (sulfurtransferase) DsrC/TusE family protein
MRFDIGSGNWITLRDALDHLVAEFRGTASDVAQARVWNALQADLDRHNAEVARRLAALNDRGAQVLAFIKDFVGQHGYSPTVREIVVGVGLSSSSMANYWLGRLERDGRIRRTSRVARSIVLVEAPVEVPEPAPATDMADTPVEVAL